MATTSAGSPSIGICRGQVERRAARLARLEVGAAIHGHLGVGQAAQHARGQDPLHEHVLLEHHLLAARRPQGLEDLPRRLRPLVPRHRPDERLHVDHAAHPLGMAPRPVEPERRAPVVHDQRHGARRDDRVEPGVEIARVVHEPVGARGRAARVAHADQIGSQAAAERLDVRDHVAPEIGRGRVAVEEHHRIARAHVHVGHLGVERLHPATRMRIGGGNGSAIDASVRMGRPRRSPPSASPPRGTRTARRAARCACPGSRPTARARRSSCGGPARPPTARRCAPDP